MPTSELIVTEAKLSYAGYYYVELNKGLFSIFTKSKIYEVGDKIVAIGLFLNQRYK